MMWRKRWVRIVLILLLLLVCGVVWVIYSVRQVRPFYSAALTIPQPKLKEANREFLNRTSRFNNDVRRPGEWTLLLTDEQINGWFGVDLVNNHPEALPKEIRDPRVKITPEQISFGVMVDREPFPVAASIDFTLRITNPRELMVRVITARVGNLPWSVEMIVAQIRHWAQEQGWTLRETTIGNDPVLLLSPPAPNGRAELTFETLELHEGEIFLRGRTTGR
jgi:hypothetical protein